MEDMTRSDLSKVKMSYRIERAYSPYKYIHIEILGTGEGQVSYELYQEYVKEGGEKQRNIPILITANEIEELVRFYQETEFLQLEVEDLNKDKIQVTDVGTTTLSYSDGKKEREFSYGYIKENPFSPLVRAYWQLAERYLPRR